MIRRITILCTALAVVAGGLLFAMTGPFTGGAGTTHWYQCTNNAGRIESRLGGTVKPTCAHATDHILTWSVLDSLLPPDPTTTPPTVAATAPPTVPPTTPPTVHVNPPVPAWWSPNVQHSINFWNQQTGIVTVQPGVQMYDTDWSSTTPTQHAAFHVAGAKSVCRIDAGQFEPTRPDAVQFPAGAIGNSTFPLGPPGSQWLDIRDQTIRNIEVARVETCAQRGGDGVDFTGLDGYANVSGFSLTGADELNYAAFLAATAHANGLAAGLNEDRAQIAALNTTFDFGTASQAQFLGQAPPFLGFTDIGRPVFDTEFFGGLAFCPQDAVMKISGIHANLALDGTGVAACPSW